MAINPAHSTSAIQALSPEKLRASKDLPAGFSRFAERLDRIAAHEALLKDGSPEELQRAAESLRLSALRSSLAMLSDADDKEVDFMRGFSALPQTPPATIQAYLANVQPETDTSGKKVSRQADISELGPAPVTLMEKRTPVQESRRPEELEQLIDKAAQRYGIDRELIKAVIKAESNFNPRAVSHAGAQGLMQLMPATARGLGVTDSFDPEQNVMAGTRFLKSMLDRYNGNLDSALAAYNWGPGNVDRKPDRLPRETRDYLVKVKQYYSSYVA